MKLVKSLFLGSAAGLAAVAGAQAADLPARKAAPVEYVRVCSVHGAGFFYVPGSDTCIRIDGRVRAEYRYVEPLTRTQDAIGFRARGRIGLDARTATAYGTLRAYIRYQIDRNTGTYAGGLGGATTAVGLDRAFVQFAGITAGRTVSFFDFSEGTNWTTLRFSDGELNEVLAYTATFGNGISATISLEDNIERRVFALPFGAGAPLVGFGTGGATVGGQRVPDVVANVRADQAWGSVQLSGALHQVRAANVLGTGDVIDTEYGWAVQLGAKVNFPQLAPGDYLWLVAAYGQGAMHYLGYSSSPALGNVSTFPVTDAYINAFGEIETSKGFSIAAGFLHYWTPTLRSGIHGSYSRVDLPAAATVFDAAGTVVGGFADFNEWRLGGNLIWSPVKSLDIGVEVLYTRLDPRGRVAVPVTNTLGTATGAFTTVGSEDIWEGRLRIQRDF